MTPRFFAYVAVALFALLHGASAVFYQWQGGTMSFSDPLNWQGGVPPTQQNQVCSTTFGAPNSNIYSQLQASFSPVHLSSVTILCIWTSCNFYLVFLLHPLHALVWLGVFVFVCVMVELRKSKQDLLRFWLLLLSKSIFLLLSIYLSFSLYKYIHIYALHDYKIENICTNTELSVSVFSAYPTIILFIFLEHATVCLGWQFVCIFLHLM